MTLRWLRGASALALFVAGTAWADSRIEARRHFTTGMSFIGEGRYEEGVAELLAAYAVRPHPNVLFNVAKAYESLGRLPDAITYYRRYLEASPPDEAEVIQILDRLESRFPKRVRAPPPAAPQASPELRFEERPALAPKLDEASLARLAAVAERLEKAVEKVERAPERAVESAAPAAKLEEHENFGMPYEETVMAASRRTQSTLEAPNAITVITGDEIRASGLTSLPEILRRVPGAEVMVTDYSSADVSFRGFNQRISNKVLVLIDGRPEYQDFLGLTLWSALTIGLEEIERVEVIRGPGSALYGANAMMGVVNIITRAPGTGPAAIFSALGGNANLASGGAVLSGGERLRYRVSGGYAQADKYSRDYADGRADVYSLASDPSLSLRSGRGNATLYYAFDRNFSVALAGGVNRLYSELYPSGLLRNYFLDGISGYTKFDLTGGPFKLRIFWNSSSIDASPQYEPIGQRSLATTVSSNVLDGELFFQKELELGGLHVLAAGASARLKRVECTYVGPLVSELHFAGFLQDEWRPLKALSLVASYRVDRHQLLEGDSSGLALSPRISLVVSPVEGHALRVSFATAFRAPTFLESYLNLRTPVPSINGAAVETVGNPALRPERLTSFEAGYRGELARLGLSWDLALYWNVVNDLIGFSAVTPLNASQAFDPVSGTYLLGRTLFVNDAQVYTARGTELGLTWNAFTGLDLRASAAVQSVVADSQVAACGPCTQAPAVKMNAGLIYHSPTGLELSADVTFVSATTWVEREPAAADATQVLNLENPLPSFAVINGRVAYRFFDNRLTVSLVGSQLGPDHQEHPFGNRINRRVYAALSVQP